VVVVLVLATVIGILLWKGSPAAASQVKLVSAAAAGPNPFTPPASPVPTTTTTSTTVASTAPHTPFGGTGNNSLCDREGIVSFLTDPSHAAQASAFANVLGISTSEIPTYVRNLVPTTLTSDTRVTNHDFQNGRAVPFQAVLQAGTAVLVTTHGELAARCRCGNPLRPPAQIAAPVYVGPQWPNFDPTQVIVIQVSVTQIYPPGGESTIPPESTTTAPSGDQSSLAIDILTSAIALCVQQQGGHASGLTYSAQPSGTPDKYTVVVTQSGTGQYGTWTVDVVTRVATAADPIAAEVGQVCPNLA